MFVLAGRHRGKQLMERFQSLVGREQLVIRCSLEIGWRQLLACHCPFLVRLGFHGHRLGCQGSPP